MRGSQPPLTPPQSSWNSNGSFQHTIRATGLIFCAKQAMDLSFILAKFGPDPWEIIRGPGFLRHPRTFLRVFRLKTGLDSIESA